MDYNLSDIAKDINMLAAFCGPRDLSGLNKTVVSDLLRKPQADLFVLFGGSIVAGGDVLYEAMRQKAAKHYLIVGGAGHTTETLRVQMKKYLPGFSCSGASEAELFDEYLFVKYGVRADFLEKSSTNCGNNITYMLDLIGREGVDFSSVILCQDLTMQRRMSAGLEKYAPSVRILNYASYTAEITASDGKLVFINSPKGMWETDRFVSLLLGEIPRLEDKGYGPSGKNFIAHVDIPEEVLAAHKRLALKFPELVRIANPRYA